MAEKENGLSAFWKTFISGMAGVLLTMTVTGIYKFATIETRLSDHLMSPVGHEQTVSREEFNQQLAALRELAQIKLDNIEEAIKRIEDKVGR